MNRIYVCHTYYNVYVSVLKELNYQKAGGKKGTMALSLISTYFKDLKQRLEKSQIFDEVTELNEVHPYFFKEKFKYKEEKPTRNLWNPWKFYKSIIHWRYISKQTEKYINIDFSKYNEIFVFCDSDPIGQYLNYKKLHYNAVEDGLDSCKIDTPERHHSYLLFKILLAKVGIYFMKDGYSRYAKTVEVNDKEGMFTFGRKVTEVPRQKLLNQLNSKEKEMIYDVFYSGVSAKKFENCKKNIMLMTNSLCTPQKRIEMYRDIIQNYCKGYNVYIKPHPIDNVDYEKEFPNNIVLERFFPIEILNIKCELEIEKLLAVYTVLDHHNFAKEKIRFGIDFLDNYQDPLKHSHLKDPDKEVIG